MPVQEEDGPSKSGPGGGIRAHAGRGGQVQIESSLAVGRKDSCPLFVPGVKAGQAAATLVTGLSMAASSLVNLVEEKVFARFNDEAKDRSIESSIAVPQTT
jgi:hypothetical protein